MVSTYHAFAGSLLRDYGLLLPVEPDTRLLSETELCGAPTVENALAGQETRVYVSSTCPAACAGADPAGSCGAVDAGRGHQSCAFEKRFPCNRLGRGRP